MKEFMEMLLDSGHAVRNVCINTFKHRFDPTKFPAHPQLRLHPVYLDTRVRALPFLFNLITGRSPNLQRFRSRKLRVEIRQILDEESIDMIICESLYGMMEVRDLRSHPVILRSHNVEADIWHSLAAQSSFWKKPLYKMMARQIARIEQKAWAEADGILSISSRDSQKIRPYNDRLVDLLPTVAQAEEKRTVGERISFLGSMDWEPNIEAVQWLKNEIWPLINRRSPELEFHLAGKRSDASDWSDPDIRFMDHGMVKSAVEFIIDSKFMIIPLRSGSGLKIKTLESLAYGVVVIGSPLAFDGIEGEDGVHFVVAQTATEFMDRLFELRDDEDKRTSIAEAASALVREKYSRRRAMEQLNEMFVRLNLTEV
jgi:glycosyltransferase involved in cell wall biosynthesis